jgi:hypothetical protein
MTTERAAADDDASPRLQPPFVCFIPLFDSVVTPPHNVVASRRHVLASWPVPDRTADSRKGSTNSTMEGVARRTAQPSAQHGCAA